MVSLVIMDSEGELRTYSRENDPDLMKALTCHLGLWGVVVEMTFKVSTIIYKLFLEETKRCRGINSLFVYLCI